MNLNIGSLSRSSSCDGEIDDDANLINDIEAINAEEETLIKMHANNNTRMSTLVQTIHDPWGPKKQYFSMKQESCRKDVEGALGVLQLRFVIVAGPSRFWNKHVLHDIMIVCIIMQNMIIEDEHDINALINEWMKVPVPNVENVVDEAKWEEFFNRYKQIKDKEAHIAL
ncbi:uncharacterized protein LOC133785814 [Humulus lupulus]|uniref:uncharacterized protein LOC133785814 n=1 Tax=Humulus lupulus TaxID=3486 RepID=UPI002B404B08|nr:uncharacterized protein LOC133785814 [Humulus lupulus]